MTYTAHKSLTQYLREQTLPKLFYPGIILIIILLLLILFPDIHREPKSMSSLSESTDYYEQGNCYVTVHVDTLYYTGINYESSTALSARIYYALEKDLCYLFLLDEISSGKGQTMLQDVTLNVVLTDHHSMYEQICASMAQSLYFSEKNLSEMTSTILFNQHEYINGFTTFCFHMLHILGIINILVMIYVVIVIINPSFSYSVTPLRKYGNKASLYAIAVTEFDSAAPIGRRNLYITKSFLIVLLKSGIVIQPLDHITWIYQTHKVHHHKGKAVMYHTLCIVNDRAKTLHIPHLSEPVIATLMNTIASRYPKIKIGNGGMR